MSKPQSRNYARYAEKITAIAQGGAIQPFTACELVQYLLDRQDISRAEFSETLGYQPQYFDNLFNSLANRTAYPLPTPLIPKLADLTGTKPAFWKMQSYTIQQAEKIRIDLDMPITSSVASAHAARTDGPRER